MDGTDYAINDFAAGYGETSNLMYIHISDFVGRLCDVDFTLTGTLTINWTGAPPSRDEMGMHVKMTYIPEPATILLLGLGGLSFYKRKD